MNFPDIVPGLKSAAPNLRGRLLANQSLAELTWFRVGGPARLLCLHKSKWQKLTAGLKSTNGIPNVPSLGRRCVRVFRRVSVNESNACR